MNRKIVVLLLAVAVACAGTIPIASAAHAANLDNNIINKNLTPLANQMIVNIPKATDNLIPKISLPKTTEPLLKNMIINKGTPGTALPAMSSKISSKLGTSLGASLLPSGTATFLFDKLSGPLVNIGIGMLMNATGLNKILHMGSEDAEQLAAIRQQLEVISAQLEDIKNQLNDQRLFSATKALSDQVRAIDGYNTTLKTFYTRYFDPISAKAEALVKAQAAHEDTTNAQAELNAARLKFYKNYDAAKFQLEQIANQVHQFLVPVGNAQSVLENLGDVILSEHRYLTAADSMRIRQLYEAAASTEAMASMLEIERNTPTDPPVVDTDLDNKPVYKPLPDADTFTTSRREFLANTVSEFVNLPPAIPEDVVIDAGAGTRKNTNNVTMYMPASTRPDLFHRPNFGSDPATIAVDSLNGVYGGGFNNWTLPTQATVTALLADFDNSKTLGQYLADLNPESGAWQAIPARAWPFVWSSTVTNPQNVCTIVTGDPLHGIPANPGNVNRYSGVWTDRKSVVWAARPPLDDPLQFKDPSQACAPYVDTEWKTRAQGGVIAVRSTGTMKMDYMGHGNGPNIFTGAQLQRTDLSGFNLTGVDLTGTDLHGSDLNGVTLEGTKLASANLFGTAVSTIYGVPASLPTGWKLINDPTDKAQPGALVGPGVNLLGADLSGMDLSDVDLRGATSGGTDCTDCKLPPGWHWTGMPTGFLVGPGANLSTRDLTSLDMHGYDLSGVNFEDSTLTNVNLTGANLSGAFVGGAIFDGAQVAGLRSGGVGGDLASPAGIRNVSGGYIVGPGVEVPGANLSGANLTNIDLTGINLTGANLTGALLNGANLTDARMTTTNLTNANFTNATLVRVVMTSATITGAVFVTDNDNKLGGIKSGGLVGTPKSLPASGRFRVVGGWFVGPSANMAGANFGSFVPQLGVSLSGTNFTLANLSGINFTGATLTNADLSGAVLFHANLSGASLTNAQLLGVTSGEITGTPSLPPGWKVINGYLVGPDANLRSAQLAGANLTGANLSGAVLNGANLTGAIWSNTTCPNGNVQSTPCSIGFGNNGPARVSIAADSSVSGVRVQVLPELANGSWTFAIDRLDVSGGFFHVANYTTKGGNDVILVNLPEGTYRAVTPTQRNYFGTTSNLVVLKK
jgi:uncharacterized protein YjbI with pentapeptide repeats